MEIKGKDFIIASVYKKTLLQFFLDIIDTIMCYNRK